MWAFKVEQMEQTNKDGHLVRFLEVEQVPFVPLWKSVFPPMFIGLVPLVPLLKRKGGGKRL